MKKILLLFVLFVVAVGIHAQTDSTTVTGIASSQTLKYGYLSYSEALQMMPEYAIAVKNEADLKAKYDEETARVESDFNAKYEKFLEGQRDFPESILHKRQTELQEMLDKNIKFKEESRRLLESAKTNIYAPAHNRLASILHEIGTNCGYAFILNTDDNACPFINATMGESVIEKVKAAVQQ